MSLTRPLHVHDQAVVTTPMHLIHRALRHCPFFKTDKREALPDAGVTVTTDVDMHDTYERAEQLVFSCVSSEMLVMRRVGRSSREPPGCDIDSPGPRLRIDDGAYLFGPPVAGAAAGASASSSASRGVVSNDLFRDQSHQRGNLVTHLRSPAQQANPCTDTFL